MAIDKEVLRRMFQRAAARLHGESAHLSEIDSRFGDGDHGITMDKIASLMEKAAGEWDGESIYAFLDDLGTDIMGVSGGSAGPLYGTMVGGLAVALEDEPDKTELSADDLRAMLASSLSEMQDLTTAKVGDKTMMDALIPAVKAAQEAAGDDSVVVMEAAAAAAAQGAKDTENYVSKFGRAKSYKEQTLGTPDAGAVSTSVLLAGLAEGIRG